MTDDRSQVTRVTKHETRFTFHVSRFALSASRFTLSALRSTLHALATSLFYWLLLALLVGLFYLAVSAWGYGFSGFPLDDAWIHQTYARNLAYYGQLAFTPGVTSAGSTAPLWSVLLSGGYWLGLPYQLWTYGLGIACLGLTGWTAARLSHRLFPEHRWLGPLTGLFCLLEWHLAWAAVSGMETILFVWLSLYLVERYLANEPMAQATTNRKPAGQVSQIPNLQSPTRRADVSKLKTQHSKLNTQNSKLNPQNSTLNDFGLGLLGGLLILTRPEGVGLVGLVGLDMALRAWRRSPFPLPDLLRRWLSLAAGVGLLLLPYVLFHLWLTGLPFPNTFYAKQAEYAAILSAFPLWWRLFGNFGPPVDTVQGVFRVVFIGAQLLLLPGLLVAAWLTGRERRLELWFIWLWWLSFLLLYGLRLPVTYQHGRYQIPAIPWLILLGLWGTARLMGRRSEPNLLRRAAGRVLLLSLLLLTPAFTVIGAQAYGRDVRIIETEMVAAAHWLAEQTTPEALLAVHDIGAVGYFSQRPLIDLAGLVTPEIIPILRDEAALLEFIQAHQVDYLVTFPNWYPDLTRSPALRLVYQTDAPWAPQAGGDNMAVYRLRSQAEE